MYTESRVGRRRKNPEVGSVEFYCSHERLRNRRTAGSVSPHSKPPLRHHRYRSLFIMHATITRLLESNGYLFLFLLVGLESLGVPLPGETALVTVAAYAALGHLDIYVVIATAIVAAIVGDNGGYWIGRKGGISLVRQYGRFIHLNETHLDRARSFFERHGPKTVFIGRFVALLRTWAAVLAGAGCMQYGKFMLYNALGAISWAVIFGTLGYVFGRNLPLLEQYIGRATLAVLVIAGVGVVFVLGRRMRRKRSLDRG